MSIVIFGFEEEMDKVIDYLSAEVQTDATSPHSEDTVFHRVPTEYSKRPNNLLLKD